MSESIIIEKAKCQTCGNIEHNIEILECYCNEKVNDTRYTYQDEYGDCDACEKALICQICGGFLVEMD